jgi:hypothetical protein
MVKKDDAKHAAVRALNQARGIRAAIEKRDRVNRAAPGNSADDVLARLRANHAVRAAVRGESS